MKCLVLTFAGTVLALAVTAGSSVAEIGGPRFKCDDARFNQSPHEECISPTFPTQSRGICSRGACYRGASHHKHKHVKTKT
jgi:hypothetical protein